MYFAITQTDDDQLRQVEYEFYVSDSNHCRGLRVQIRRVTVSTRPSRRHRKWEVQSVWVHGWRVNSQRVFCQVDDPTGVPENVRLLAVKHVQDHTEYDFGPTV